MTDPGGSTDDLVETPDPGGAFPRLTDDQIALLREGGRVRRTEAGQVLIAEGQRDRDVIVVLAGKVAEDERADRGNGCPPARPRRMFRRVGGPDRCGRVYRHGFRSPGQERRMTQQDADRTVTEVAVVDVDVFDVYAICRDPLLLAPFVDDRVNVELIGDTRSRWTFPGPDGVPVSCTAELVGDVPERVLAWRVDDGPLPHEGHVDFLHHGPGTASQLTVQVRYHQPPDGAIDPDLPRRRLHRTLGALAATTRRR